MEKFFRRPLFFIGVVLAICGLGFGFNDLLRVSYVSGIAKTLLILGLALLVMDWMRVRK